MSGSFGLGAKVEWNEDILSYFHHLTEIPPNPLILSLSKDACQGYNWAMSFYAYLLRCRDGSYYAGHTDDLEVRFAQHQSGLIEGYTSRRRPVALVWTEMFSTRDEAFAAERKLKGWSRAKKEALIAGDWKRVQVLARNRQGCGDLG